MDKHGDKPKKSVGIKMLGAVCSLALIVSMGVIVIAGRQGDYLGADCRWNALVDN